MVDLSKMTKWDMGIALQGKIDQEKVDRHSEDQVLHNEISWSILQIGRAHV